MLSVICLSFLPLALGFSPWYWLSPQPSVNPVHNAIPSTDLAQRILPLSFTDQFSPRFGNLFGNTFPSKNVFSPVTAKKSNKELCDAYGGTLVGEECLEFFADLKTYEDARTECMKRNGDLYVPKKFEGFFFQKYFLYFLQSFSVHDGKSLGWIGAKKESPGEPLLTVEGDDVTMDAIFNLRPVMKSQCIHILVDDHVLAGDDCHAKKPYTCEYQLFQPPSKVNRPTQYRDRLSFFDRFLPYQHRS